MYLLGLLVFRVIAVAHLEKTSILPVDVMEHILLLLQETYSGEVTLTAQDGKLIQLEYARKIRLDSWNETLSYKNSWSNEGKKLLKERIELKFSALLYGKLTITVNQGKIKQMNRLERQRFMDGDGI